MQHPYEFFILDFFCVEQMLAIEVDGGIHSEPEQKERDAERTLRLNELGIRVLRFTNEEIYNHLPAVLTRILAMAQPTCP